MTMSFARVPTRRAADCLAVVAAEWQRSNPAVSYDCARAVVPLRLGTCELRAADGFLDVTITGRSISDVALLEDVVSEHLDDAAPGEELRYQWVMAPSA